MGLSSFYCYELYPTSEKGSYDSWYMKSWALIYFNSRISVFYSNFNSSLIKHPNSDIEDKLTSNKDR
jgi:hypothetical protein